MADTHTVTFLLLDVAVVIAAARAGGFVARKLGQPAVVGEIAAGIALGPSLLGLFPGNPDEWLFPTEVRPLLLAIAQLGLVLFMFIVGLELDMRLIKGRERAAASISLSSIILPFALGAALALILYDQHDDKSLAPNVSLANLTLFLGIAMSITAFPVLARILNDRGMMRTVPGVFSLAAAAVDDIVAWTLLAFVTAIIGGENVGDVGKIVGLSLLYCAVTFLVVRPLLARLVEWRDTAGRMTPDILAVVLIGLFLSAAATEWIGIHLIIGAFVFGAVMPKVGAEQLHREILERLEQASVLLLLPMFFVVTGLAVDLSGIGLDGLWQLVLVLLVAIAGKFLGAFAGARASAIPGRQSAAIAVLMNTRGLTELVILSVGLSLDVLTPQLYAMLVVMALVTTVLTAPLLRLVYPDSVVANDIAEAERLALAAGSANRAMVVLTDLDASVDELLHRHRRLFGAAAGYDVVLAGVLSVTAPAKRLEVGVPIMPDFAAMASAVEKLNMLGSALPGPDSVSVLCRFSADPVVDLTEMAENANIDFIFLDSSRSEIADGLQIAPVVTVDERAPGPDIAASGDRGAASIVCVAPETRAGRTAILVAAGLALNESAPLTIVTGASRRRMLADLEPAIDQGLEISVIDRKRSYDRVAALIVVADEETDGTVKVVDHVGTSEEGLGDRVSRYFERVVAERVDSAAPRPILGQAVHTHTTAHETPERH
uniref:cation:proton antiporter n=1 Tax=Gordonia sp. B7-2 TaxID=3420932 RepID=UPI003D8FF452